MPIIAVPSVDAAVCNTWSENQQNLYNALPFYLAKMQVERRKTWTLWSKFCKKRRWKQNQGDTLRAVRPEPSPHLRQFAFPSPIKSVPKKDVMNIREVKEEAQVYRHRFESPQLHFYPSFNDFMDHVDDNGKDIMEKIERYEDIFIRGNIFHMSPFAFVATGNSVKLINTNPWKGTGVFNPAADGKTTAIVQNLIGQVTSHLTLPALNHALTIMETDLRIPFFSGSGLPKEDAPLDGMYCLVCSSEAYNQFTFDPYLQQNKNCDLDVVNQSYRGKFFGRITSRLEDLPIRCKNDATYPAPELRVEGGEPYNEGETLPNPVYAIPDENGSPIEVAWMVGSSGHEVIDVGPPPGAFTGDSPPHNFPKMFWNGEVKITKQFLVPCIDQDTGQVVYEMNTYGEYLKFVSQVALGILHVQRRNIIPFFFKRKRGV